MRRLIKVSFVALAGMVALMFCLLSASVYTFNALTAETVIAQVSFEPAGAQQYIAYLRTGDRCDERVLRVLGDQWRIDAEFLKWKYWATLFGLDSQYRLDRFEGRYRAIDDQNNRPALAHDLGDRTAVDIVDIATSLGSLNFLFDATYGTSTYHDVDTRHTFYVYKTPTGIFTRALEWSGLEPADGGRAVEVTRACGAGPGYWQRFVGWTDAAVAELLAQL